jgi:hypothetical protein
MKRHWLPLVGVALCTLPFSSCTCGSQTAEAPPKAATRPSGGFGSVNTSRKPPEARDPAEGDLVPQAIATHAPPELKVTPVSQAEVPENFPKDVPVFDGATVKAVQQLANKSNNVVFDVDAETPQVFKFYKDSMKKSGWKSTGEYEGKEQSFLSFTKDKTVTNVSVSTDPKTGKKVIAIMYYQEEPLPFAEF